MELPLDRLVAVALAVIPSRRQPPTWAVVTAAVCVAMAWAGGVHADGAATPAQEQVFAAERAFARSMADRDVTTFARHVADEAIFFGAAEPLRGKTKVLAGWSKFFEGATPPFSWEPDQVEVLPSGSLALSTGRVRDPQGKVVARFNSIWRLEASGQWRVVFDKGSPPDPKDLADAKDLAGPKDLE